MRCTCCNTPLKMGEWKKRTPDGKENTFCNQCTAAAWDESTTMHDPQLISTTDRLYYTMNTSMNYEE